jgi:NDP-sugar pyrophosphorylase family protein
MKAMVLAAGVGTRLDPLTTQLPKPLVPVANIPVMQHILNLLLKHGFSDIAANLHYLPQQLIDYFGDGSKFGVKLMLKYEEKLSGDAGGVRACKDFFHNERFLVIMGDLVTDADLTNILKTHVDKKALATIALKQVDDVSLFGVVARNKEGMITGFQEKPKPEEALSHLVSTGIYILEPEVFNYMPPTGEFGFGRQLFPALVAKGLPVLGVEIDDYWSDVGTIPQYRKANFDALKGLVELDLSASQCLPKNSTKNNSVLLGKGSMIDDGASINGLLMLGKNSHIQSGAAVKGTVVIGDNCLVESGVTIADSILWSGAQIGAGATLSESVIGINCKIEPRSKIIQSAKVQSIESDQPRLLV